MRRYVTILDTGAGSSYVRKDILPDKIMPLIGPLKTTINIKDAGNKRVDISGSIDLTVQLGTRQEVIQFYVVERLSTDVILGCDFCDKHVETIRPRRRIVELDDSTCLLYTSPSPRDQRGSRMPSSA